MTTREAIAISDPTQFSDFIKCHEVVIVKATASWCGPCQKIKPLVVELLHQIPIEIAFVVIDIDKAPTLKRKLRITSVPYIVNFIDGEPTDVINTSNEATIRKFFEHTVKRLNDKK